MLDRTWYNTLHNDTGSDDGSLWRKEDVDALLDSVDAEIARLDAADIFGLNEIARIDTDIAALQTDATVARTTLANRFLQPQTIVDANVPRLVFERTGILAKGRLLTTGASNLDLTWNAAWDGTQWVRDDPTVPALALAVTQAREFVFIRWAAGDPMPPYLSLFRVGTQGQLYERGRDRAIGEWGPVPFSAADFSTGIVGTSWAVDAAAYQLHRVSLVGETMAWRIILGFNGAGTSLVTGSPGHLLITVPEGLSLTSGQAARLPLAQVNGTTVDVTIDTLLDPGHFRLVRVDGQPFTGRINLMGSVSFEFTPDVLP